MGAGREGRGNSGQRRRRCGWGRGGKGGERGTKRPPLLPMRAAAAVVLLLVGDARLPFPSCLRPGMNLAITG